MVANKGLKLPIAFSIRRIDWVAGQLFSSANSLHCKVRRLRLICYLVLHLIFSSSSFSPNCMLSFASDSEDSEVQTLPSSVRTQCSVDMFRWTFCLLNRFFSNFANSKTLLFEMLSNLVRLVHHLGSAVPDWQAEPTKPLLKLFGLFEWFSFGSERFLSETVFTDWLFSRSQGPVKIWIGNIFAIPMPEKFDLYLIWAFGSNLTKFSN